MAFKDTSNKNNVAAVQGDNTAGGDGVVGHGRRGVVGISPDYQGVFGHSVQNAGVVGESDRFHALFGISHDTHNAGCFGANDSPGGFGLIGVAHNGDGIGVSGESPHIGVRGTGRQGVVGISTDYQGVFGHSEQNAGVVGESDHFHAVYGVSHDANNASVFGTHTEGGDGVRGEGRRGVVGLSRDFQGVYGKSEANAGLVGESDRFHAIWGVTHDVDSAGVIAFNTAPGGWAGIFAGKVKVDQDLEVAGDIKLLNADVAEEFGVADDAVGPGSVVVLDDDGHLVQGSSAHDTRVVGVVSGAGQYRPGIVLDRSGGNRRREPVALLGKVATRVDASYGPVRVGDLLTTSPTPGAAMRVTDHAAAAGAVIGKALAALPEGVGLVPVLVNLR